MTDLARETPTVKNILVKRDDVVVEAQKLWDDLTKGDLSEATVHSRFADALEVLQGKKVARKREYTDMISF